MKWRLAQVLWVTAYESDLESDLSAIHRIDDMHGQPADRVFRLARRLSYYPGAIRTRVLANARKQPQPRPSGPQPGDGVDWVPSDQQALARSPLSHLISFGKGA